MSLSNEHTPRNRSDNAAHRAARFCLFAVCLVAVTAFACSKDSGSGAASASTTTPAGSTATPAKTGDTVTVASGTYCDTPNDSAEVWNNANHHRSDPLAVSQQEYDGWKMFHVYCYRCHGTDAMGSDIAPNLRHSLGPEGGVNRTCFITTVWNGQAAQGDADVEPVARFDADLQSLRLRDGAEHGRVGAGAAACRDRVEVTGTRE